MKQAFLGCALSLAAEQGVAQPAPGPGRAARQLTVRVTLPSAVGTAGAYVGLLKEKGRLRRLATGQPPRTSNPVLVLTVSLPSWLARRAGPR